MTQPWTRTTILELARSYQATSVLAAAADLELFGPLADSPRTADELARQLDADLRGMVLLLDALVALGLVDKTGRRYALPPGVAESLGRTGPGSVLAMVRHQANCMRRWAGLAETVKTGRPLPCAPSIRGAAADREAFLLAMNDIASTTADSLIAHLRPLEFHCLLDVGGASGTWTIAFLRACPTGRAILFDLPDAIPLARRRFEESGLADRVTLVAGDFYDDPLPGGADLAWVSAIAHQNSRAENRILFGKIAAALVDGGRIAIRDMVMEPSRTEPVSGTLFAINMLVATPSGGTFTLGEYRDDLAAAGFADVTLAHGEPTMNSIVTARKR